MWNITIFSQPPRWSEKALFCTIFFFSEYRFWSQVGASGVVYLSFLRIYDEKRINFLAQRHIKVFLEFKLFWILNFLVQITPTAIWECISWIPGFNGKMRRNKNDFFLEVWCVKNYHFFTARGGQKRHFFFFFFFSEYQFWSQVGASGVVYLCFLRIYGEKNDKFSSTMTY